MRPLRTCRHRWKEDIEVYLKTLCEVYCRHRVWCKGQSRSLLVTASASIKDAVFQTLLLREEGSLYFWVFKNDY